MRAQRRSATTCGFATTTFLLGAVALVLAASIAVPAFESLRGWSRRADLLQNNEALVQALQAYWKANGRFPQSDGAMNPPWDLQPGSGSAPGARADFRWDLEPWKKLAGGNPPVTSTAVRFAYFASGEGTDAHAWLYALHDFDGDGADWNGLGWDCTHVWVPATGPGGQVSVAAERFVWREGE